MTIDLKYIREILGVKYKFNTNNLIKLKNKDNI